MTDYNDGKWHSYEGIDCPVHPKSKVEFMSAYSKGSGYLAGDVRWDEPMLFRVIKPYVEPRKPREWWLGFYKEGCTYIPVYHSELAAKSEGWDRPIHVREVLPE